MPLFQQLGSGVRNFAGRTATWALDLNDRGPAWSHPYNFLGLNKHDGRWTFMGVGRGKGPNWWIPDMADTAKQAGRWGTAAEFGSSVMSTYKNKGIGAGARMAMRGRWGGMIGLGLTAAFTLGRMGEGQSFGGALASEVAEQGAMAIGVSLAARALPFLSSPWLLLPTAAYFGVTGYMTYRNKMRDFRNKVRQTEFIGDMSAFNTEAAYTMRQRSQQAIERSFSSSRRALGSEASYYSSPNAYGMR